MRHFFFSAILAAVAMPATAFTLEETTTGAAAAIVVAQKCYPQHLSSVERYASEDFMNAVRALPPYEQSVAKDAARMKLAALLQSGQAYRCQDVEHLRVMARTWGFGHLLLEKR